MYLPLELYLSFSGRRPIALDVLKLDLDVAWTPRPMLGLDLVYTWLTALTLDGTASEAGCPPTRPLAPLGERLVNATTTTDKISVFFKFGHTKFLRFLSSTL